MELSEDESTQKYGKKCGHCSRNTLLPYAFEWVCFSCGHNVITEKNDFTKSSGKKYTLLLD